MIRVNEERLTARLVEVLQQNQGAVALLMPRAFALKLADEVCPVQERRDWGIPALDEQNRALTEREQTLRSHFVSLVREGGHVGSLLGCPAFVVEDAVICALTRSELEEQATLHGFAVPRDVWQRIDNDGQVQWG